MAFMGREQPIVSAPAANVRLMCRLCNLLLTVWAGHVTIDILPDDVLLHIFLIDGQEYHEPSSIYFVELEDYNRLGCLRWTWHRLVHVCRRWRSIVFASPNYLDLRLIWRPMTPMKLTSIWPPFPIIITNAFDGFDSYVPEDYDFDAAIVHPNRVREIHLFDPTKSLFQRLASATWMQEQFPVLTRLTLVAFIDISSQAPVLPDGFLGGSTPRLRSLALTSIIFPALPKLLTFATHLVHLALLEIPLSGYLSPKVIVTALAMTVNLESLIIRFLSPLSFPDRESRSPPPPTLIVLPALTRYEFRGASEYLEDFVARIDAPSLNSTDITFFPQPIFVLPRFAQFMGRIARFHKLKNARVDFTYGDAYVEILPPARWTSPVTQTIDKSSTSCKLRVINWRVSSESSLAHVFTSFFPSIYIVEHLHLIHKPYLSPFVQRQADDTAENVLWVDILYPFTGVKNLYLTKKLASSTAPALQGLVGRRTTEVLPNLQSIFLGGPRYQSPGPIPEGIQNFVAARQLFNPITVSIWE
jgi:hypothetical protein